MDQQSTIAENRRYRDSDHSHETPSQYIRDKKKLVECTHEYQSQRELIYAILKKPPFEWG